MALLPDLSIYARGPIPQIASTTPMSEKTGGSPGSGQQVPAWDHQHPRLTSVTGPHTLDATGRLKVTFTRTFSQPPGLSAERITANTLPDSSAASAAPAEDPVDFQFTLLTNSAGLYTGAIVVGQKRQKLPTQTSLNGGLLLTPLINALNGIMSGLSNFDPFGANASGTQFTLIAVQTSAAVGT